MSSIKKHGPRVAIKARVDGLILTPEATKLYHRILGVMKRQNSSSVWLHDAESRKILGASDIRPILIELRTKDYFALKQSRFGCQYSLIEDEQ